MKTTTSSTKEPRSKYVNMLWAWLIAKELRAPRKTLNKHLKSGIGYLRVVILPPSTNSDIMIHSNSTIAILGLQQSSATSIQNHQIDLKCSKQHWEL
jgi:hypothetical protein